MKQIIFVTGGCRSGKSRFALEYANKHFKSKMFFATAPALDDEMKKRIKAHQEARGPEWAAIEEKTEIANAVASIETKYEVILLDCMTLWLSNLIMAGEPESQIFSRTEAFIEAIQKIPQSVIIVSNEVGYGIVPVNDIARQYRDIMGTVNQRLAACADVVVWTVVGLPQVIKGNLL
ncbi:MAG: bifunctional adenosylcobinamide kinase/adenosylcobinamide-phosphate guanylyltransferase, partial [Desulfobacteraceae bacterium]|jgi:adenosylcobinamide kinase/adenosylcobinamide-phosphate guanylyltransferase